MNLAGAAIFLPTTRFPTCSIHTCRIDGYDFWTRWGRRSLRGNHIYR